MEQVIDIPTRIDHPGECLSLLEVLCQPGGASLLFVEQPGQPQPVLLMEVQAGEQLVIDVTAVPELAARIARNESFYLCGQVDGAMLRTPSLGVLQPLEVPERLQFACCYPEWLELLHRRGSFRAELRGDLQVQVELHPDGSEPPLLGRLINLSLGGCLVELSATQAVRIEGPRLLDELTLKFPGGQRLSLGARICHIHGVSDWQTMRFGCEFVDVGAQQERYLWFCVREIEREKARNAHDGDRGLKPSPLFSQSTPSAQAVSRPGSSYRGMGQRLGRVAAYLDAQLLQLRLGAMIDSTQLSRFSDLLLELVTEDRESLLFAVRSLPDEPPVVQHCIAVAGRLADMARARGLPREALKAIVASGMVHDLGKVLLPVELQRTVNLDAEQRRDYGAHVGLLLERLESCKWLAAPIVGAVVGSINERLDGSGYPRNLAGEQLAELARMASVVDVADAMARPRPDRPAFAIDAIYRHLLTCSQLDPLWSQRYIRHFGMVPVGSLVRYASGPLAWVRSLDGEGQVVRVQLVASPPSSPDAAGELLSGAALVGLGRIEGLVVPEV